MFLKQSTSQVIKFGPFLDKTNGVDLETGLATNLDNATTGIRISKDGGDFGDRSDATAPTYDEMGMYNVTLGATDTNTVGELFIIFEESATCLPVWARYWVIEEAIYDALFGAAATGFDASGRVDVGEWLGTAVTSGTGGPDVNVNAISDSTAAATNAEIVFATDFATNYNQTDNAWVTNGTTFIGTGWNTGKTGYSLTATTGLGNQTANITGSVSSVTGNVDGNVTGSVGSNLELGPAEVNTEVDNAIVTYGLDHLISTSVADTDVADNSIIAKFADSTAVTADFTNFDWTTDSLRAIRDNVGTAGVGLTNIGTIATCTTVTNGVTLANGAITNASLAGNMEIVFETDFATNYNTTTNAWVTNYTDTIGTVGNANVSWVDANNRVDVGSWLGTAVTSGTGGPDVNVNAISDSTAAAVNLEASALTIVPAVCEGTPSTTVIQTDLAEATDDHYIGRIAIFVDGAAAYQATDITDYTGSTGTITVTALTTAPSSGDNLVIV